MGTKEEDFVEHLFVASTHHTFLFFTNLGRVYWRKVYEIPQAGRLSRGKAIGQSAQPGGDEKLATVMAVPSFEPGNFIIMVTRQGLVKKDRHHGLQPSPGRRDHRPGPGARR